MKKVSIFCILLSIVSFAIAQPSTQRQLKNVLIEEFTGINCPNCPRGHMMADSAIKMFQPYVYSIGFHTGGYAAPRDTTEPDFRTTYADQAASLLQASGYPTAAINRAAWKENINFSTSDWLKLTKRFHQDTAPVNLSIEMTIDTITRIMKVKVMGYFTQNVDTDFSLLDILIVQSNILGPQAGANDGNNYNHKHVFRDNITPLYGDTLKQKYTSGMSFTKEYTYIIPTDIKKIAVKLKDLQVIAFVTQPDHYNILNVVASQKPYNTANLQAIIAIGENMPTRYGAEYFPLYVRNDGNDTIKSINFEVNINNQIQNVNWTGIVLPHNYLFFTLPTQTYPLLLDSNIIKISTKTINATSYVSNTITTMFKGAIQCTPTLIMEFKNDRDGEETKLMIKTRIGEIIYSKGPFANNAPSVLKDTITLNPDQYYILEITDSEGDGLKNPNGYLKLYNSDKSLLFQNYDISDNGEVLPLYTTKKVSLNYSPKVENSNLYYHKDLQTYILNTSPNSQLSIFNALGQSVFNGRTNSSSYTLPKFKSGIYLLQIKTKDNVEVIKFKVF